MRARLATFALLTAIVIAGVGIGAAVTTASSPSSTVSCSGSLPTDATAFSLNCTVVAPPPPTTLPTGPTGSTGVTGPSGTTGQTSTAFYVDPNTDAPAEVKTLTAAGDTTDAALIEKIASQPQAVWLGAWNSNNGTVVNNELTAAKGQAVLFVLFGVVDSECSTSSNYQTSAQYETFVNSIVSSVGGRNAWFDVEPDGLDEIPQSCGFTTAQAQQREQLISYAAQKLATVSSHVYIDAGCTVCQPVSVMGSLLNSSGISYAAGFALNTSGFDSTANEDTYGHQLSALVGGKHFIIDTSRNGSSAHASTWCNPSGQLLGADPTTVTGDLLDDGSLWIKYPGQSDGNEQTASVCSASAPASGSWYESYAIGLASTGAPTPAISGLTVDDISNVSSVVAMEQTLPVRPTTRVVFDDSEPASYYAKAVTSLDPVSGVMGELEDSSAAKSVSAVTYQARVQSYVSTLGSSVNIWEIGNETNGNWTGSYPVGAAKVAEALTDVPIGTAALTLYANEYAPNNCGDGTSEPTPVQWSNTYLTAAQRAEISYVFESFYPTQCQNTYPSSSTVALEMASLHSLYPNAVVGFGEVGLPNQASASTDATAAKVMAWAYGLDPNLSYYVGGYFWWYGAEDLAPTSQPLYPYFVTALQSEKAALNG